MDFIETPVKTPMIRVGKGSKMSKSNQPTVTEAPKTSKKYAKTRGEHFKDVIIAMLITAVIAFVGGMHFANKHNAEVQSAVKAAQAVTAEQTAVKK